MTRFQKRDPLDAARTRREFVKRSSFGANYRYQLGIPDWSDDTSQGHLPAMGHARSGMLA